MPVTPTDLHVARRADLLRAGRTRGDITAAIRRGDLVRLGTYWLGTPRTPSVVAAALSQDARLTCVDALGLHGVWVPPTSGRHQTALYGDCHEPPGSPGVIAHPRLRTWPDREPVLPVAIAASHAARCLPPLDAAAVLDSIAHLRLLDRHELDAVLRGIPDKTRRLIGPISARSMSGTETRVRRLFEKHGVHVVAQWWVDGVGSTDLRVGERLIVECDSRAHHAHAAGYATDRLRDRRLVALGYHVVRLTWEDVMLRWEETSEFLLGLVRRRVHRATRTGRSAARATPT